ncbi:MAG: sulfite exporter TauE/SafE family protein [Candidatus Eiseniibacteriota bacterium]|nr:MAG: sulfite exporter TauE/SafE family protein [Candidatus Eisenbacteria bacterium]
MSQALMILVGTAATLGLVHTLVGPDHYLPFIAMSKARRWTMRRTVWITVLCGVGHVASSIVLGLIGIAAGITLKRLELVESTRGEIAAWLLMAFGLLYLSWGIVRIFRDRKHTHSHLHADGTRHEHVHTHITSHTHPHDETAKSLTPWVLFVVFVFGPCEPLIPLLMYPAAAESSWGIALVAAVFAATTIATMTTIVVLSAFGLGFLSAPRLARYGHAMAGATVFLCGVAIQLGL